MRRGEYGVKYLVQRHFDRSWGSDHRPFSQQMSRLTWRSTALRNATDLAQNLSYTLSTIGSVHMQLINKLQDWSFPPLISCFTECSDGGNSDMGTAHSYPSQGKCLQLFNPLFPFSSFVILPLRLSLTCRSCSMSSVFFTFPSLLLSVLCLSMSVSLCWVAQL